MTDQAFKNALQQRKADIKQRLCASENAIRQDLADLREELEPSKQLSRLASYLFSKIGDASFAKNALKIGISTGTARAASRLLPQKIQAIISLFGPNAIEKAMAPIEPIVRKAIGGAVSAFRQKAAASIESVAEATEPKTKKAGENKLGGVFAKIRSAAVRPIETALEWAVEATEPKA